MGKARHNISNWRQYNRTLVNRGTLTFWMDEQAIRHWHCHQHHGRRGRGFHYSDSAIVMLKAFFGLPLRALEGFINSIFQLMDVPLTSSISKRAQTVNVTFRLPSKGAVTHLVIDATGLKVFDEGEWKQRKHGKDKRRVWHKLHLAVDARNHEVIAAEVSLENMADNEVLPTLLNPLRRRRLRDPGMPLATAQKISRSTIPPRKNAGYWEEGHPRNDAVTALKSGNLAE